MHKAISVINVVILGRWAHFNVKLHFCIQLARHSKIKSCCNLNLTFVCLSGHSSTGSCLIDTNCPLILYTGLQQKRVYTSVQQVRFFLSRMCTPNSIVVWQGQIQGWGEGGHGPAPWQRLPHQITYKCPSLGTFYGESARVRAYFTEKVPQLGYILRKKCPS